MVRTFMLTPNIDVAAAHTFDAFPVMSSTGDSRWDTLNSGDRLTGDGSGSSLNIITVDVATGEGSQTSNILPTITNVETLNANVYHELNIESQYVTGMKNVNLLQADHSFKMKGVDSKLENITVSNLENNIEKIDTQFQVNSTYLEGADDALNLATDNVVVGSEGVSTIDVKPTNTTNGYEVLNLASNGGYNNAFALASTAANINVSGAANVEIAAAQTKGFLKNLDASAATGNVAVYGLDNVVENVKLGAGNDIVSFIGSFNPAAAIDAGAGDDLLAIAGRAVTAEELNNAKNFETISLAGADSTVDLGKLTNGVKNFEVASGWRYDAASKKDVDNPNKFIFTNASADNKFTVINNSWLGITNANGDGVAAGAEDSAILASSTTDLLKITGADGGSTNVTLVNTTAPGTLTKFQTNANDISIVSTGNHANTIGGIDAGYVGENNIGEEKFVSIKVSGDQNLKVTLNEKSGDYLHNGYKVDASALQGSLFLTGANGESDIVIGTANNDEIATGQQIHGVSATEGTPAFVNFTPINAAIADTVGAKDIAETGDSVLSVTRDDVLAAFKNTVTTTATNTPLSIKVTDAKGTVEYAVSLDVVVDYLVGRDDPIADNLFSFEIKYDGNDVSGDAKLAKNVDGWTYTDVGIVATKEFQVIATLKANALTSEFLVPLFQKAVAAPAQAGDPAIPLENVFDVLPTADGKLSLSQKAGTEHNLTSIVVSGITPTPFFNTLNWDSGNVAAADKLLDGAVPSEDKIVGTYDKFTGGDGADQFIFGDFATGTDDKGTVHQPNSSSETPTSEITDFESGVDTIKFTKNDVADVTETNFKTGKLYGSLQELYKAAKEEFTDNLATTYFVGQVGNDTYLFNDAGQNDGTWFDAVKLTGVDLTGIAASDINNA